MTTASTWQWGFLPKEPSPYIPMNSDFRITATAPLLFDEDILFRCQECHAPITLHPIPIIDDTLLCPDCFRKHTGALLNIAAAQTGIFLREIKK